MTLEHGRQNDNSETDGDIASPPTLSPAEKEAARALLLEAWKAAQNFDGSEPAEQRLFDPLILFEEFVRAHGAPGPATERETSIAEMSYPDHPADMPLTIDDFLDHASNYYVRLKTANAHGELAAILKESGAAVRDDRYVFVKTDDGALRAPESDHPTRYEVRTLPRLALLIAHLRNDGVNGQPIYTDDLVVRFGRVSDRMMRTHPYHIVQIPRLKMEIAVCDQVGEITFVKKGTVGPEFWAFMSKDALKSRDDIEPIEFRTEAQWWSSISEALATHSQPGSKINVTTWAQRKSNLDIALVAACLLEHRLTTGEWLSSAKAERRNTLRYGPYAGAITLGALDAALSNGGRGLPGGSSIAHLNETVAMVNGLDYVHPSNRESLDLDLIKESLLAHRTATGRWLSFDNAREGRPKGSYLLEHGPYAGQLTVAALQSALAIGLRGLPGGSSIALLNAEISEERGLDYTNRNEPEKLVLQLVRESLLAHRMATGAWLTCSMRDEGGERGSFTLRYGPYAGMINVGVLDSALARGGRGLPGRLSISKLNTAISKECGLDYVNHHELDDLDFNLVRASLLEHRRATGEWLTLTKRGEDGNSYVLQYGPYAGAITAHALNSALQNGHRGLPGGSSIASVNRAISNEHQLDYVNKMDMPPLQLGLIRASLLAHFEATGRWLSKSRRASGGPEGSYVLEHGPYAGAFTVGALSSALSQGGRGLPGGSSIAKLNRELAEELHHRETAPTPGL